MESFKSIFITVVVATALIVGAFIIQAQRPEVEMQQPAPEFVKATGKCASCHRQETHAIVNEFERSEHAAEGITCLDCHQPAENQSSFDHRGFTLAENLTSQNCQQCHADEYRQYLRSRHRLGLRYTAASPSRRSRSPSLKSFTRGPCCGQLMLLRSSRAWLRSAPGARGATRSASRTPTARSAVAPSVTATRCITRLRMQ